MIGVDADRAYRSRSPVVVETLDYGEDAERRLGPSDRAERIELDLLYRLLLSLTGEDSSGNLR